MLVSRMPARNSGMASMLRAALAAGPGVAEIVVCIWVKAFASCPSISMVE